MSHFSAQQAEELSNRHSIAFISLHDKFMIAMNGHPYLTRRAMYLVAQWALFLI